ncbi:MAG: hypothetical protein NZ700_11565 [Gemmataceae bacterium]|nr:hypothetical protein [Gemmataceae bacterium]MDW8265597.1 hypothetical protein [Gemmataceae bacterium]
MTGKSRKEQLEAMLRDDPHDPFLHYALAMECVSEGNDEEAIRRFGDLIDRHPDYPPAYMQGGQALARLGRPAEAAEWWRRGIEAARRVGDRHAADEMAGLLQSLP